MPRDRRGRRCRGCRIDRTAVYAVGGSMGGQETLLLARALPAACWPARPRSTRSPTSRASTASFPRLACRQGCRKRGTATSAGAAGARAPGDRRHAEDAAARVRDAQPDHLRALDRRLVRAAAALVERRTTGSSSTSRSSRARFFKRSRSSTRRRPCRRSSATGRTRPRCSAKRRLPLALAQFGLLSSEQCASSPRGLALRRRAAARPARTCRGGGPAPEGLEQAIRQARGRGGSAPARRRRRTCSSPTSAWSSAVDEALPIYSGGLGVLAGDHLKAAAELGVPLVGVGLLYRGGYFTQGIDATAGRPRTTTPVDPAARGPRAASRSRSRSTSRGETVAAGVWRKDVGSVPLYLLEVDWLTDALYGGDREHRIRQELLLGVGGVRALAALGIEPTVFHLNEGHSAFLALERVRALVAERHADRRRARARPRARPSSRRTRPSRPGTRSSPRSSSRRYVGDLAERGRARRRVRCSRSARFGDEPRLRADAARAAHCRPTRTASPRCTARSRARCGRRSGDGTATAADRPRHERRPPRHVARPGARRRSSARPACARRRRPTRPAGTPSRDLDPEALWRRPRAPRSERLAELAGLDPERLTIGFARRFATYKRAGLVFTDLERLLALPVQIVVAGKAHPQDDGRQGRDAADRRARARPAAARPDRLPRGLRHRARADDHPGLRRLAEQPAPRRSRPPARAG